MKTFEAIQDGANYLGKEMDITSIAARLALVFQFHPDQVLGMWRWLLAISAAGCVSCAGFRDTYTGSN